MSKKESIFSKDNQLSNYSSQVILIFDYSGGIIAAKQLKIKWKNNKNDPEKCRIIQVSSPGELSSSDPKFSALNELDSNSRLYIIIHATSSKSLFAGSDSTGKIYDYSQSSIVNFLTKYLKPDENITISMVVCNMAMSSGKKNYFKTPASELHLALYNKGFNTTILARTKEMRTVMDIKQGLVYKQTMNNLTGAMEHKQPGSKVIYRFSQTGKQIFEDAYFAKWKARSLKAILRSQKYVSSKEQADGLKNLAAEFKKKSPANVVEELKMVLAVKDSFIIHKGFSSIWKKQDIKEIFQNLIKEGEKFYEAAYVKTRMRKIEIPSDPDAKLNPPEVSIDNCPSFDELEKKFEALITREASSGTETKSIQSNITSSDEITFEDLEARFKALTADSSSSGAGGTPNETTSISSDSNSDSDDRSSFDELESRYNSLVSQFGVWNTHASPKSEQSSSSAPSVETSNTF